MGVRSAVACETGMPLDAETVQLEGSREGGVMVGIKATGICHTGEYALSGDDPAVPFPRHPRA